MIIRVRLRYFLNTDPFSPALPPAAALTDYTIDPVYDFDTVVEYRSGMKTTKPHTTNTRNQVIQASQVSVGWDQNGNMISKSNGYTFHYDIQNRLREATNPTGANQTMLYDPFNRTIVKKVSSDVLPLTFTYTTLLVAFYARADQRQERTASAYNQNHLFHGHPYDEELRLYYVRNRYLDQDWKKAAEAYAEDI